MTIVVGENTQTADAQESLKQLAAIAKSNAPAISMIFAAIVNSDIANNYAGENTDACFLRLTGATALGHASISTAFRALVMASFTKETGLAFALSPAGVAGANAATRQAFNSFCRRFFNSWAIMLISTK